MKLRSSLKTASATIKEGDLDFHYLIVSLSGNTRLFNLLCDELYHLLRLYRVQTSSQPSRPAQAFKEHHRIVDAIEERDAMLAELLNAPPHC